MLVLVRTELTREQEAAFSNLGGFYGRLRLVLWVLRERCINYTESSRGKKYFGS